MVVMRRLLLSPVMLGAVCLCANAVAEELSQRARNVGEIYRVATSVNYPFASMIRRYNLADELKLTDGQIKGLANIEIKELAEFYPELTDQEGNHADFKQPIDLPPRSFDRFLMRLKTAYRRFVEKTDEEVLSVLSTPQRKRLLQVAAQLYLIRNNRPRIALELHDIRLPVAQERMLIRELNVLRRRAAISYELIQYRDKIDLIRDFTDSSTANRIGEPFAFGYSLDDTPSLKSFFTDGPDPAQSNPRRSNK